MARMNPEICRQWQAVAPFKEITQSEFFRQKGVDPAVGRAYLCKYRKAQREARDGQDA